MKPRRLSQLDKAVDANQLESIVNNFKNKHIVVVGDIMLDVYLKGIVTRISPEAPIPVVELNERDKKIPGGAANVACNITALGGKATLVGIVGQDTAGRELIKELKDQQVNVDGIVVTAERPTTEKIRVIANTQQVVRIDREIKNPILDKTIRQLLKKSLEIINKADAVIFEDYNKGVLVPEVISKIMRLAQNQKKIIAVDPKFQNFFHFSGATLVKPNLKEALEALGILNPRDIDLNQLGPQLMKKLKCSAMVITRGEEGMTIFEGNQNSRTIQTTAREVYDVSGAGDTVIATITLALIQGSSLYQAAVLANFAAGIEVEKAGVATVSAGELLKRIFEDCSKHQFDDTSAH